MMRFIFLFSLFLRPLFALLDLEENPQDFILEIKKIEIPGYPDAFNPSIFRWDGRLLMSFRFIPNPKDSYTSYLGIVWLHENFDPDGPVQVLNTREPGDPVPSRAEDGRIVQVGEKRYFVYSDNTEPKLSKGGFRVYISELNLLNGKFFLSDIECLSQYPHESREIREKNWTPFDYKGNLLLAFSQVPHEIFCPVFGTGECFTVEKTPTKIDWEWGVPRGGSPALPVEGEYLSFFHSSIKIGTLHSDGKAMPHYFMGVYTFSMEPPFEILRISPRPIVGRMFYRGPVHNRYWGSVRVVFPCGFIEDEKYIWVSYGRQDHELWIAKLDKKGLLDSLVPVGGAG
ncbi:MAG: hypothetical protein JSS32_05465 [Verrucomicrobia bacterium]|nr:hypothetical protein [Verrucomicrobiota bacterium]